MKRGRLSWIFSIAGIVLITCAALWVSQTIPAQTKSAKNSASHSNQTRTKRAKSPTQNSSKVTPKQVEIDLNKAVDVAIPSPKEELKAEAFKTTDGKEGWVVKIPGNRPIATPAYSDGLIFVGGGYGSHEFYAFNAETGEVAWQIKTGDDGPTAAVVEDGCVSFNTESCTVIVADAKTGKILWQEWLGDPLMSQPAISKGRLYIAYPAGQRNHQQIQQIKPGANQAGATKSSRMGHRLLCADLKTGSHIWEEEITSDVITAPVINGDRVYFTCFDGTSFCLNATSGALVWKKQNAGTSAPIIANGQVVLTQKQNRGNNAYEGLKRLDTDKGEEKDKQLLGESKSDYLKGEANGGNAVLMSTEAQKLLDSSVGFGTAPQAAQLSKAQDNVGVSSVAGGWAYQGSRVAQSNGMMMNAQGKYLNSIRAADGFLMWRAEVSGTGIGENSQIFSPPALGQRNMYLCSAHGHMIAVGQKDGKAEFIYSTKYPMAFQPALAQGNIYTGTTNGFLICLKTGDKDADGWHSWGGNAQHNKSD
jgi:Ca-activated chloride channel homolog